ncbi:hypothetical protein ACIG87_08770 [Micromonospora sp. NPDC051925]|uniref:hypothetical protein n=1 Tax=Micromonospora sp. NPDC051925 TaxID=3364288 RepID=UPI0037CB5755
MGPRLRTAGVALLALLPFTLLGCGLGEDDADDGTDKVPAPEASTKARERVQAYLDAMTAKDPDAGRNQLCAAMQVRFDAAATGPNGDFADHFEVPEATITDIRTGPLGQEVSTTVTVTVGKKAAGAKKATRPLLFTVTREGADWCIAGEEPGGHTSEPSVTP